ncbi:multicopper oxidase-domain-containing protein [Hysterangium stoloniferum]|nr:multicopper oxidase-domain-containing protein [Hysterangium stoloniferum]
MSLACTLKTLVVACIVFLSAVWLLVRQGDISISRLPWTALTVDVPFDARLHPEKHAARDPTTIELDWVIRQELRSPDGVQKPIYTVNGLFPGPTIEARPGDRILLRVHNKLATETTAIHFHGIRHLGSNSMDGTPGLTQCAIQPKHSFLYNFTITTEQSGTFWWHSHSTTQRADGLYGGLVIHDTVSKQPDIGYVKEELRIRQKDALFSERILLIGDWYHRNATEMLAWYRSKKSNGWEPTPETALYNGVNTFDCSRASRFVQCDATKGRKPSLLLDPNSITRLRLVNTGNLADLEISLGSHDFLVVEADGSPIFPQRVNSVTLSPGQRYSVILVPSALIQPGVGDSFWLRLTMSEECFNIPSIALDMEQHVQVFYGDPQTIGSSGKITPFELDSKLSEFDPLALVPLQRTPLPAADEQIMIYVNSMKLDRLGGIPYGYVNQTSWVPPNDPLLLQNTDASLAEGWGKNQLVVTTDRKAAKVIELIINNLDEGPHPFHLHGHHFYPLLTFKSTIGWGMYNYTAGHHAPEESPVLRDTLTIPRRGHAVIRFLADAPGMWLFHCHVLVHLSTG